MPLWRHGGDAWHNQLLHTTASNINCHYNDVIMSMMASQITSLNYIVYSTIYSRRRSKKTSKLSVTGLCDQWPLNSPRKGPLTLPNYGINKNIEIYKINYLTHRMEIELDTCKLPILHTHLPIFHIIVTSVSLPNVEGTCSTRHRGSKMHF